MRTNIIRTIVFRGRKPNTHEWAEGSLILAPGYTAILEAEDKVHPMDYPYLDGDLGTIDGKATPVEYDTIGQFTGVYDRCNNRIFEGDICRVSLAENTVLTAVVRYAENVGTFILLYNDQQAHVLVIFLETTADHNIGFEVIGNIYDSPELHTEKFW